MEVTITTLGAIVALVLAIVFIFIKIPPVYSLMLGAIIGGLVGGGSLTETIGIITAGASSMMTTVLRILAAGVLAGTLIRSGAADSIALGIINLFGEKRALFALSLATCLLTAIGVFIDIAVITVAPIALAIANRTGISKSGILLAMIGGGKAGNLMSPNPNAIAVSDAFGKPLTSVMAAGILPAIVGLAVTYILAGKIKSKGSPVGEGDIEKDLENDNLPSFSKAIAGPLVAIILLTLRPLFDINIDPMLALPLGGIAGAIIMGRKEELLDFAKSGLEAMTNVAIILIGTGALAGVIQNSMLGDSLIALVGSAGLPMYLLAPISGILMCAATASTTSGATVASQVFGPTLIKAGVNPLASAQMIHSGSTVLDHLPHGSFFHATGGAVNMEFKERISLIGYESLIGLSMTITSTILYGILGILG